MACKLKKKNNNNREIKKRTEVKDSKTEKNKLENYGIDGDKIFIHFITWQQKSIKQGGKKKREKNCSMISISSCSRN